MANVTANVRRVAVKEQAEACRRQRVSQNHRPLGKAGGFPHFFQRASGRLRAEPALFHLAGDFVDHRDPPAVCTAPADAPHKRAPTRLQKDRRRKRRNVDFPDAESLRHPPRRLFHTVGFAAVFQQQLRRRADDIQLLFVCLHKAPFWGFAPNPTRNLRFLDFPLLGRAMRAPYILLFSNP